MLIISLQLQRPLNQGSKSQARPEFRFLTEAILFHVNIPIHGTDNGLEVKGRSKGRRYYLCWVALSFRNNTFQSFHLAQYEISNHASNKVRLRSWQLVFFLDYCASFNTLEQSHKLNQSISSKSILFSHLIFKKHHYVKELIKPILPKYMR